VQLDPSAPGCLHFIRRRRVSVEPATRDRYFTPAMSSAVSTVRLGRPLFSVHLSNAFQRHCGTVVVDLCGFRSFELGGEFGFCGPDSDLRPVGSGASEELLRITVSAAALSHAVSTATEVVTLCGETFVCDFPVIAEAAKETDAPCVFVVGRYAHSTCDVFDCVARVDLPGHWTSGINGLQTSDGRSLTRLDVWQAPLGVFAGEPQYIPACVGDTGATPGSCVLVMLYGSSKRADDLDASAPLVSYCELAVFCANSIATGPVARLTLPGCPYGFHGVWLPPEGRSRIQVNSGDSCDV
jgi:hypothetical protein